VAALRHTTRTTILLRSLHRDLVHAVIVSPLVSDVRHIAAPFPTPSFETLECGLFRDD